MNVIEHVVEAPRTCPYLPTERSSHELSVVLDMSPSELDTWLERGWRRFGPVYFRPACGACSQCVSLRLLAPLVRLGKSERRIVRTTGRLRRVIRAPILDSERLDLYARWHANRESARGWEPNPQSPERYALDFAFPHAAARELAFYDDDARGKLVGLGLFDETPRALSAAFFFYDPDYSRSCLGTANILALVAEACARSLPYVYLGFCVEGCPSLKYKGRFSPAEALLGHPSFDEDPEWVLRRPSHPDRAAPGDGKVRP
jgi:arginine-tRNA-protein transferase